MKLISLNIENDKHFDRVIPFLKQEDADIICLQEVLSKDISFIEQELGLKAHFVPMIVEYHAFANRYEDTAKGIALLSKHPITEFDFFNYYDKAQSDNRPRDFNHVVISALIQNMRICTTHLTWTPDGHADEFQRKDTQKLLEYLNRFDSLVLCGDLNAPRGREIFSTINERYIDHIPQHYTNSLDDRYHRQQGLNLMVDGLFSTKDLEVTKVTLIDNLSDHMAIVAHISKKI